MESSNSCKTYLGIDYGARVVGLAIFHEGLDPFVLLHGKIIVSDEAQVLRELKATVEIEGIDEVVLGLPLFTDGQESEMTKKVKNFARKLEEVLDGIPVHLQDETLTTFEAEDRMKNSPRFNFKVDPKQIDALCASIILEDFLKRS
jgi:putative holliday junction resolvase